MMALRRMIWRARGSLRFSPAYAGLQREDDGGADHERGSWGRRVGEGESIPGGVIELAIGVGPVAGVVDEDHERDGETAEDVDRGERVPMCREERQRERSMAGPGSAASVQSSLKWGGIGRLLVVVAIWVTASESWERSRRG